MTDNEIYKAMVANATEDFAKYANAEYDGEEEYVSGEVCADGVKVFDATDAPFEREYTIANPDTIDLDWIKERIVATPSAIRMGIDTGTMAKFVFENIRKHIYATLKYLVFVGDGGEEDFDFLSGLNDFFASALEEHELPSEHQLGIQWFTASCAVIHVGNVAVSTREMIASGELDAQDEDGCVRWGILTSVAHELRHLAQSNPYIPEEVFCTLSPDDEEDAELFAQAVCEKFS